LISLVFADAPNESGIAAPPAQHIVAVTQYIVDFSSEPMLAESARNGAGKFTSAQQYDLSRIPRSAQAFLTFPSRHRMSI
jgi:hypothetical protein